MTDVEPMMSKVERIVKTVGVVGAGTMGRGIAQVSAAAGLRTLIYDAVDETAAATRQRIGNSLDMLVGKGRIQADAAEQALQRIKIVESLNDLGEADVIVEAAVEDLSVKKEIFRELERIAAADAVLATNTSSLSITAIAAGCKEQGRIAGFHFFNPPPAMRLVEIVGGINTSRNTISCLVALANRLGKTPIVVKDSPGFLVNHAGRALMPEALRIISEGIATPEQVDELMRDCAGFRMGPFQLLDLVGADVAHSVMESIYNQYYGEPRYQPSTLLATRVSGALLGRKTGRGFYVYDERGAATETLEPSPSGSDDRSESPLYVVDPSNELSQRLHAFLLSIGVPASMDAAPPGAITCVAPVGEDCSHACARLRLDPTRTVAFDMILEQRSRLTLMVTPLMNNDVLEVVTGALNRRGIAFCVINDSPGFVVQRLLAMIVNIGTRIAELGIAEPRDVDVGVKLGLNYPEGPLELGDRIGARQVVAILDSMFEILHDPKYAATAWLRRRSVLGCQLAVSA